MRTTSLLLCTLCLAGCHVVLPLHGGEEDAGGAPRSDGPTRDSDVPVDVQIADGPTQDGPLKPPALVCQSVLSEDAQAALRGVWGGWPNAPQVIAVGDGGKIIAFDPAAPPAQDLGSPSFPFSLHGVWFASMSDVRMVGEDGLDNTRFLHYEGTPGALSTVTLSPPPGPMLAIHGNADGDCYMVGTGQRVYYVTPTPSFVPDTLPHSTPADLTDVWVTDDNLAIAVGTGGAVTVAKYGNGDWSWPLDRKTSTFGDLTGLWVVDTGPLHLITTSRDGVLRVLKMDRTTFNPIVERERPGLPPLNGVWGVGKVVYAVGDAGALLACTLDENLTCKAANTGTAVDLDGVWARGTVAPDVYVVGDNGTFLRCRP